MSESSLETNTDRHRVPDSESIVVRVLVHRLSEIKSWHRTGIQALRNALVQVRRRRGAIFSSGVSLSLYHIFPVLFSESPCNATQELDRVASKKVFHRYAADAKG